MSNSNFISHKSSSECSLPQPFTSQQYKKGDTLYQILVIEFNSDANSHDSDSKINWKTKLITRTQQEFLNEKYKLDDGTKKNLEDSYGEGGLPNTNLTTIGSTLPSPGSMLNKDLINTLLKQENSPNYPYSTIELNNFYESFRTLLHTRKMSQLIAKTWNAALKAENLIDKQKEDQQELSSLLQFAVNNMTKIQESNDNTAAEIFDGLIARELFLLSSSSEPDKLEPDNLTDYYPLKSSSTPVNTNARFLILPNSKGWQSLGLSLLMAGQAYYYTDKDGNFLIVDKNNNFSLQQENGTFVEVKKKDVRYRQVNQSILSTGEIVMKYALDVSWNLYKGDIKELDVRSNTSSPAYLAILPYPAIPSKINLSHERIKEWATAADIPKGDEKFPFYIKKDTENQDAENQDADKYLIGVQNYTPPYPYLPSSCC